MKISVVIPAFNAEQYLARAIDSVLAQTRPADEIIVVDDGSTDGTVDVARHYGDAIRLIEQPNGGASVARNTGIEAAGGDWIAFLDADDEWLPDKLALQTEHLARHLDLHWTTGNYVECRCRLNDLQTPAEDGRSTALLKGRQYYDDYIDAYMNGVSGNTNTMLVCKQTLFDVGLFRKGQLRMNDDDMWFRIAYRHRRIGYLQTPLSVYHLDIPNSILKTYDDPMIICDFLQRHYHLAAAHQRLDKFLPCAQRMARNAMHPCWTDRRVYALRAMSRQMHFLLPLWYRAAVYVLTLFPGLTRRSMPLLRKINKIIKIPL